MSTSRLFSVFVVLALAVVAVLTISAGIVTSGIVSSPRAALDLHERHAAFVNPSAAIAEQARLEYRRGEWAAAYDLYAPLDAQDHRAAATNAAELARLDFRQGEWSAANVSSAVPLDQFDRHASEVAPSYALGALDQSDRHSSPAKFDIEQARLQWR